MRFHYRIEPARRVEEALERARVPESKVTYLPEQPSAWKRLTVAAIRLFHRAHRAPFSNRS